MIKPIKSKQMKRIIVFLFAVFICGLSQAQYATQHHIAPAPWQYWSDANEIVVSTLEDDEVVVSVYRSDGPLITSITINAGEYAASYRFQGDPTATPRNDVGNTYTNRGLIIESTAPVLVNLRNIASDATGTNVNNIKGNASLVSLGNESRGEQFRLGYYRSSFGGLTEGAPIYSAMATEDVTTLFIDGVPLTTLNAGESRLFTAPVGALLEADNPITVNVGNYGDTPTGCGGNGQDGTFIQVPPVDVLGSTYMVIRGGGEADMTANAPEQTTIIASQDNTIVEVTDYMDDGTEIGTTVYTLANAGDFETFHHGDGQNQYSSSLVESDQPVVVYSGTAVGCETDISVVLPIGGCSGINDIRTRRFLDYVNNPLPYFCTIILEDDTEPVLVNGNDIETITGTPRMPIGDTGLYMISFEDTDVGVLDPIVIQSNAKLTTSIVQLGGGYSMSAYFSAFNEQSDPPTFDIDDCVVVLTAEPGMEPYQWYLNGQPIAGAIDQTYTPVESGYYSVSGTQFCGETVPSEEIYVPYVIPIDIDLGGDQFFCSTPFQHILVGTPLNIENIEGTVSFEWYKDGVLLPDTSSLLTVDEPGEYTVVVSYDDADCSESQTVTIATLDSFDVDLGNDISVCDTTSSVTLDATPENAGNLGDIVYTWFFNGVQIPGEDQATIQVSQPGIYSVDVVAGVDCMETDTIELVLIDFSVTMTDMVFPCDRDELELVPVIGGIDPSQASYQWSTGENTETIVITQEGNYWVEVTYMGCTVTEEVQITLAELPVITIVDDIEKCPGDEVQLTVSVENPTDNTVYRWYFSGQPVGGNTPEITVTEFGIYTVEVDSDGCISEEEVEVRGYPNNKNCTITQGISPGGSSGQNDNLDLTFLADRTGIEKINIYNRNGNIVYEKENYINQWYGQSNDGKELPTGVYYYYIILSANDATYGTELTGWIYINR